MQKDPDSRIILLDDHLISKIAAGEVIERPASVVKEVVENSIDAGATQITVEVEDGGRKHIRITDNGCGMTRKDAELALMRHATSKIKDEDDLAGIHTLGFRGEALASIVSVSRFELRTKTKESPVGTQIVQYGAKERTVKDAGMPEGTAVTVGDLFFNTPARMKYMKSASTELGNIIDVITRYTLIYPEIYFKLVSNGNTLFTSPKTSDMQANIATIYGKDVAEDMLEIRYDKGQIKICGYISKPSLTRAGKRHQSVYVNRRYIKNKLIVRAVYDAYHTFLTVGRHPVFIVCIEIDPRIIDVNVHPAKTEIRIEKENELYEGVYSAVKSALEKSELIPEVKDDGVQRKIPAPYTRPNVPARTQHIPPRASSYTPKIAPRQALIKETKEEIIFSKLPQMQIIGQIGNAYIVAESGESMYLIDQHAACERVNYEKLRKDRGGKSHEVQALLNPKIIELSQKDAVILNEKKELLKATGFDIEPYSDNSFSVRAIPVILGKEYSESNVTDVINDIIEVSKVTGIDKLKDSIIKMIACKASIKAGERLTDRQMVDILKELEMCDAPYTCPHGRPTIIEMTFKEIEKRFKRT